MNSTINDVKAWMTNGLLVILSWFVIDLKNDVKVLLDRTARLEERVKLKQSESAHVIHFKGIELLFDRNKKLTKTEYGYEYI